MTEKHGNKQVLKKLRKAGPRTQREPKPCPSHGGAEDLRALMHEPLSAPIFKDHLSLPELQRIDESRTQRGEELARTIFELANQQRAREVSVYVETIEAAVRDCVSEENQAILETACAFFRTAYGAWCRERGKSIEMLDNIVHRTGRDSEALLAKLIRGFDVKELSRQLWDLQLAKRTAELQHERTRLYELTNAQVRELRHEYNTIPAQDLAQELHAALHETNLTGEPMPDVRAIRYVLLGRSALEIKQIEFQFNERWHFTRNGAGEAPLSEQIAARLAKEDAKEIGELLKGFNSKHLADAVHRLLVHCAEASEVVEAGLELHPDFAGNFRRDYSGQPCWERELRAREQIDLLLRYLSPGQFKNVARALQKHYGEQLTPALYLCNRNFDARRKALDLFRAFHNVAPRRICRRDQDYLSHSQMLEIKARFRTSTHGEITQIIKKWSEEQKALESTQIMERCLLPLEYLSPEQLFHVKEHFLISTGIELDAFVQTKMHELCRQEVPKYVARLVKNRLSGISRLPLKADLFELFATSAQRRQNYFELAPKAQQLEEAARDAEEVQRILDDRQESRKAKALIEFMRKRTNAQLDALEKAYLERNTPPVPLIEAVRQKVAAKRARLGVMLLLSKFDPWAHAEKLHQRPEYLLNLLTESPHAVAYMLKEYRALHKEDLRAAVKACFKKDAAKRTLCQSVLLTEQLLHLHKILKSNEAIDAEGLTYLVRQLTRARLEVLAVEAGYNRYFGQFNFCYDKSYGTLLQRLRVLATTQCLPRRHFASAILLLENVEPEIPVTMQNHLSVEEIGGETILKFHGLLREFKDHLKILQKAYNALNEHATLRETIYELRIPLEVKNKTLLLLDGYDPDEAARRIRELVASTHHGEDLGARIVALLAPVHRGKRNRLIPRQHNWIGEMYHQIRVSYEANSGSKLLRDLHTKEVPLKGSGINAIAYKLYGEAAKTVIDVRRLLTRRAVESDPLGVLDRKIVQALADLLPPLRERALDMYDAYYAPSERGLVAEIKSIKNQLVRSKALRLLQEALTWDVPTPPQDADEEKNQATG